MVVFFTILALILPDVRSLRALSAVRPLRLAIRVPEIKVVVSTLVNAIRPAVFALVFCLFLFFLSHQELSRLSNPYNNDPIPMQFGFF